MNIAFEISPLLTASGDFGDKSGVYRYMYSLLDTLSKVMSAENKNSKLILFSFNQDLLKFPLNPDLLRFLRYRNINIINNLPNLPNGEITDSNIFRIPPVKFFLKILNNVFKFTDLYRKYMNNKRFNIYLDFLEKEFHKQKVAIIYHSETGFYPVNGFTNIITIYDLTTVLMPEFHRTQTIDLQKRKIAFARRHCQGIVCISKSTEKDLMNMPGFSEKKICVVYPGLCPSFENLQEKKDGQIKHEDINLIVEHHHKSKVEKRRYLLYYGTFEPRKNLPYLVKAFVELQQNNEIPIDYKLVLMGGEGWGYVKNSIRNFVRENFPIPEKNNIIILDFLSDEYIAVFIKNASAVVYPSLYEGFGLPVLESMALGVPVITSNTSSLPEVGGDALIYINPDDYYDLKEKLKYFINNPQIHRSLSEQGFKQSQKFNWNKSSAKLYSFLASL